MIFENIHVCLYTYIYIYIIYLYNTWFSRSLPESACNAGDVGDLSSIPGLGRSPGGGKWQPTSVLPGEFHVQRSLVFYSPKGHKALDKTK